MVDFGSKISGYVKSEAQTFVQKNINKLSGQLAGMGGGVINSLIGSVSNGLSQNLFDIGNSFDTIESVVAQKMDTVVAGGEAEFAAGGKCSDRASAADISSMRNPSTGNLRDYMMNVFPETVIDEQNKLDGNNQYVLTEASSKYSMKLRFYKYERSDLFKKSSSSKLYFVDLPLPLELTESLRSEYSTQDMQTVGNFMNNGIEGATGSAMGAALLGGENFIKNSKMIGAVESLTKKFGVTTDSVVNAIEQYIGVAPNPNPSVMFKGPSLREFTFSWMFNPRNAEESKRIKQAIKKMKGSALPSTAFGTDTGLLRYPHVVMINLFPWDNSSKVDSGEYGWNDDSYLKFKRCVINGITTNYAPTGAPSFYADGSPTFIQMNISFKEIEFFTANDWNTFEDDKGLNSLSKIQNQDLHDIFGGALTTIVDDFQSGLKG